MDFVFYSSLKRGAQKAIQRGNGKGRKYIVNRDGNRTYISVIGKDGRAKDFIVVKGIGKAIKGVTYDELPI